MNHSNPFALLFIWYSTMMYFIILWVWMVLSLQLEKVYSMEMCVLRVVENRIHNQVKVIFICKCSRAAICHFSLPITVWVLDTFKGNFNHGSVYCFVVHQTKMPSNKGNVDTNQRKCKRNVEEVVYFGLFGS